MDDAEAQLVAFGPSRQDQRLLSLLNALSVVTLASVIFPCSHRVQGDDEVAVDRLEEVRVEGGHASCGGSRNTLNRSPQYVHGPLA